MRYDFDQIIDRVNTRCAKYDERVKKFGTDKVIPLWIADMVNATGDTCSALIISRLVEGKDWFAKALAANKVGTEE